jgi:hypothetical protein
MKKKVESGELKVKCEGELQEFPVYQAGSGGSYKTVGNVRTNFKRLSAQYVLQFRTYVLVERETDCYFEGNSF